MSTNDVMSDKFQGEIIDLTATFNEIVKKFRSLHGSISDSYKNVPKATGQLDKISEQTEAATNQMLDTVERITEREQKISDGLSELGVKYESHDEASFMEAIAELKIMAEDNCSDAYVIMDSLQFQDITSQQVDHAAHMLEEIEGKLNELVLAFSPKDGSGEATEDTDSSEELNKNQKKERAFDPHADMFEKKTNQDEIDEIFDKS